MGAKVKSLTRVKSAVGETFYGELGLCSTPGKGDLTGRKVPVYSWNLPGDVDLK